jgi:hypothetical protein
VQVFMWACFQLICMSIQSRTAGLHSNPMFSFVRNYQPIFQSGHIILYSISDKWKFPLLHIIANIWHCQGLDFII